MASFNPTSGDVYQRITDSIVAAIEAGAGKYEMPWHARRGTDGADICMPMNVASRRSYRGINVLALWAAAEVKSYSSGVWGTYKQWRDAGGQVRKGETATMVVFWKFFAPGEGKEGEAADTGDKPGRTRAMAKAYFVFNAQQVDGWTPQLELEDVQSEAARLAHADAFFAAQAAQLVHGGDIACYVPSRDMIRMPAFADFREPIGYYSTLAHEHVHWTGADSRLKRDLKNRFGSEAYAGEELVAELGAAFTLHNLGLAQQPRVDHAQYIASWLRALKNDKRAIFTAAAKAQQAADWMAAKAAAVQGEDVPDEPGEDLAEAA